ncbi:MAG: hypothetical protein HYU64_13305 [Armatimonadetes bacterium]|nr:hypothetical protein [Armatimonadota bacterium]
MAAERMDSIVREDSFLRNFSAAPKTREQRFARFLADEQIRTLSPERDDSGAFQAGVRNVGRTLENLRAREDLSQITRRAQQAVSLAQLRQNGQEQGGAQNVIRQARAVRSQVNMQPEPANTPDRLKSPRFEDILKKELERPSLAPEARRAANREPEEEDNVRRTVLPLAVRAYAANGRRAAQPLGLDLVA